MGAIQQCFPIPDGMAVDDKHNVYVTGWLEDGTTFFSNDGKDITVVGLSPAQTTFDYPDDCFLAQYDQDGNAQWVTDIGGYKCNGSRVAASHSGKEVTVVGYFGNINPDNSNFASPSEEETVVTSLPPGKNDTLVTARSPILTTRMDLWLRTIPQACC